MQKWIYSMFYNNALAKFDLLSADRSHYTRYSQIHSWFLIVRDLCWTERESDELMVIHTLLYCDLL